MVAWLLTLEEDYEVAGEAETELSYYHRPAGCHNLQKVHSFASGPSRRARIYLSVPNLRTQIPQIPRNSLPAHPYPGVYIEEIPSGVRTITGIRG
jgi:hypothetical protein